MGALHRTRARAAAAAFVALATATAAAQAPAADRVAFRHLTQTDGLSSAKVTSVAQDRLGFIWIATIDGLNRYDGYQVKEYQQLELVVTIVSRGGTELASKCTV